MKSSLWKRPFRPRGMVEATRGLFAALALASLTFTFLVRLTAARDTLLLVALASATVLGLSWCAGYVRKDAPWGLDVVDAMAILTFALASQEPGATAGFVFAALWFRSLYGSMRRSLLRTLLYVGALSATVPLWTYVPGHIGETDIASLAGVFPIMFVTAIVGQLLGESLRAREQDARRDMAHASAGSELLGVTDAAEIDRIAWTAIAGICAATPGLRALKVFKEGSGLRVEAATGGFAFLPMTLPGTALAVPGGPRRTVRETTDSTTELDKAAGIRCAWACLPLPDRSTRAGEAWLLLGSPQKIPARAIETIGTLATQVTRALSSSATLQKLTLQATLDSLTGLVNRASFNAGLAAVLDDESSRNTTVLFVDLDDFKSVNDVFGHAAGDQLLQEVAARLCRATRPEDLCARLGGDEFAVLLRGTDAVGAAEVAQRIVQSIATPTYVDDGVVHVSASVGVATATNKTALEQLLHRADAAMYAAKARGKGRIQVFEPGPQHDDSSQRVFEQQLAAATANGELIVHYQPILSVPDGRCTAVEALVRWKHPKRGLLYPDSFIEDAERIGAIREIGAFVLRQACADAAIWREAEPSWPVAIHVNVSALQLDDAGFVNIVARCLSEHSLPPAQLVLEVTETIVISSPLAIERLNVLADQGVTIAIDDFGTGYSALTTLRSLPAQIVKIDKSFVAGCADDPLDRVVIEAVVKMAAQMGMHTIAEGVESSQQRIVLGAIGADAVQGYLYLRPTTADEFSTWLDGHIEGLKKTHSNSEVVLPFAPLHSA